MEDNMAPEEPKVEAPVEDVSAPEVKPEVNEAPKSDIVFNDKPKKNSGMMIGMIVLLILAIGGIGFGIWAMMDGGTQKTNYEKQISDLRAQNAELLEKVGEDEEINTEDYIYINEWGLKIKIPENLKAISYRYTYGVNSTSVAFWGAFCSEQCNYYPDFVDPHKNSSGLGTIIRYPKGTEVSPASQPVLVFSDDEYDYRYAHVQAVYSTDQSEIDHETGTVDLITKMLSDSESYSKI